MVITESGLFLRAGVKNKFINGKTCWEKIKELQREYKNGEYMRAVTEFFKNRSVMTTYGNFRVYIVDTVSFDLTVTNKFIIMKDKDGVLNEISLEKYYKDQYDKTISVVDQPLLVSYKKTSSGNNEPIYLIPELCYLTGMDDDMRSNEGLKKNMTRGTKITPKEKMDRIYQITKLIYAKNSEKRKIKKRSGEEVEVQSPDDIRAMWGCEVTNFMEFKGRILETPDIIYQGEASTIVGGRIKNTGKRMLDPKHLTNTNWAVICTKKNMTSAQQAVNSLQRASGSLGVRVDNPKFFAHDGRNRDDWVDHIKSLNFQSNREIKILLIVLDRFTQDYYGEIKRHLNSELGILSQVVKLENLSKNLSFFSNVLNQMVVKMGGVLYNIHLDEKLTNTVKIKHI